MSFLIAKRHEKQRMFHMLALRLVVYPLCFFHFFYEEKYKKSNDYKSQKKKRN